jgi:hypothetical protein
MIAIIGGAIFAAGVALILIGQFYFSKTGGIEYTDEQGLRRWHVLECIRQNTLVAIVVSAISMAVSFLLAGAVIWQLFLPLQHFFLDIFYPHYDWIGSFANTLAATIAQGFVAGHVSYSVTRTVCVGARIGLATSIVGIILTVAFLLATIIIISHFGFTGAIFWAGVQLVAIWCGFLREATKLFRANSSA